MFKFLDKYLNDNFFKGEVIGFNDKNNKLIIKEYNGNSKEKTIEVNIFDNYMTQNINEYKDWENKLYDALKKNGVIKINILSTDNDDNYGLKIFRKETIFDHVDSMDENQVILINYVIMQEEEVLGEVLSFQKKSEQNDKANFIEWIDEEIENVNELNVEDYSLNYMEAITICNALNSEKEIDLIWDMFWDKNNKESI